MKKLFVLASVLLVFGITIAHAASPDGNGPWADSVVSSTQGQMKNGLPVPPARSNPDSAVGIAENDTDDNHFFSLGFGGNIVLQFDNPISNGVVVVEATNPSYPIETASIDLSSDGVTWIHAGNVNQDGQVDMPENLSCAKYVRVTDTSDKNLFSDDTADAYDVDGVKAVEGEPCGGDNTNPTPTPTPGDNENPTPTPTPTDEVTPTPTPGNSNNDSHNDNNSSTSCTDAKPGNTTLTNVDRTSGTTAKLTWTAVTDANHYSIAYGTQPGVYVYGVVDTGNVTTYTVGGLDPNARYYFQVTAVHNCTPGNPSNENSTGTGGIGGGDVLGASTLGATGSNVALRLVLAIAAMGGAYVALKTRSTKISG